MEQKIRILDHAQKMFMRFGPRSVTLDEIAKELGISKKTIYQFFQNKAHIVYEVVEAHIKEEEQLYKKICEESSNALEELVTILKCTQKDVDQMAPNLVVEMQKYYPDAWELIELHSRNDFLEIVKANLRRGIKEGLFRNDMDVDIVARIRIWQIEAGFDQSIFPPTEYDPRKVLLQSLMLYMHGIVTAKGKEMLAKAVIQSDFSVPQHIFQ